MFNSDALKCELQFCQDGFHRKYYPQHDSDRKDVLRILEGRIAPLIPCFKTEPQDHGAIQRPLLLVDSQSHQKGRHHTVMCSQKRDPVTRIWQRVQDFLRSEMVCFCHDTGQKSGPMTKHKECITTWHLHELGKKQRIVKLGPNHLKTGRKKKHLIKFDHTIID